MSADIAKSAMAHLNFFDDMMSKAQVKPRAVVQDTVNTKFLFKRDGFNAGVNKKAAPAAGGKSDRKRLREGAVDADSDASGSEASDDDADDDDDEEEHQLGSTSSGAYEANKTRLVPVNYASLDELKARLRAKVEASRVVRAAGEGKRALKKAKKAQEAAAKGKARSTAQQLARDKNKGNTQPRQKSRQADEESSSATGAAAGADGAPAGKGGKQVKPQRAPDAASLKSNPDNIKFDFSFGSVVKSVAQKDMERASAAAGPRGSGSAGAQLSKIHEFKQKVDHLKESGRSDEADQLEHASRISKALARAQGERIEDNEKKLKKERKLGQAKKEESRKTWAARARTIESQQRERADKRANNIKERLDKRKAQKMGTYVKPKKPSSKDKKGGSRK